MGSKTGTPAFPLVELDTTLHDMLRSDMKDGETDMETFCAIKPNSDHAMGTAIPLSDKYVIHCAQMDNGDDLAHLQMQICSHLLTFFAGPMKVMYLAGEGETDDEMLSQDTVTKNATRTYAALAEKQRPVVKAYANRDDCVAKHDGSKIRWCFGMDYAERLPYLLHPDVIYDLNSKRWLAINETLKSANDTIIDCMIKCPDHRQRTKDHKEEWYYGGRDCERCVAGVEAEIRRVHDIIQRRQPPFVLKLTQSLSAVGTNIVTNDKEKSELLEKISQYLSDYLPRITAKNVHLYTTSLILSDCLDGETMALNFYVHRDGSVKFLGACHQLGTGESGRQNTAITFADQPDLQSQYQPTLDRIGKALHEDGGYWGAVGADIMTDTDGNHVTIDLNVRTPLSLLLYLFKGHFHDQRGFGMALVYECVQLRISRDELEDKFRREFEEGRLVIIAYCQMGNKNQWAFGLVLGGESKKEVDGLSDRILEFEI